MSKENREILFDVISQQYLDCELTPPENLEALKNKGVFTVTTGHQLCAFGGPQYFIHKIVSVIKNGRKFKIKVSRF